MTITVVDVCVTGFNTDNPDGITTPQTLVKRVPLEDGHALVAALEKVGIDAKTMNPNGVDA